MICTLLLKSLLQKLFLKYWFGTHCLLPYLYGGISVGSYYTRVDDEKEYGKPPLRYFLSLLELSKHWLPVISRSYFAIVVAWQI